MVEVKILLMGSIRRIRRTKMLKIVKNCNDLVFLTKRFMILYIRDAHLRFLGMYLDKS